MAGKKAPAENTKKLGGKAKKDEAAAAKAAEADAKKAEAEANDWSVGAKGAGKK